MSKLQKSQILPCKNNIKFEIIDVDLDKQATRLIEKINKGKRIIPTLNLNGSTYTNPDNATLGALLCINAAGTVQMYGADWCPDCHRVKNYLTDNDMNFQFIDVDAHYYTRQHYK